MRSMNRHLLIPSSPHPPSPPRATDSTNEPNHFCRTRAPQTKPNHANAPHPTKIAKRTQLTPQPLSANLNPCPPSATSSTSTPTAHAPSSPSSTPASSPKPPPPTAPHSSSSFC